jgi:hypothetical protein
MTDLGHPLISEHAQFLGMILDRPAIGLPKRLYSHTIWTNDEVARLVRDHHVAIIAIFPSVFDVTSELNDDRLFVQDLVEGHVPPWATLLINRNDVRVYSIDQSSIK